MSYTLLPIVLEKGICKMIKDFRIEMENADYKLFKTYGDFTQNGFDRYIRDEYKLIIKEKMKGIKIFIGCDSFLNDDKKELKKIKEKLNKLNKEWRETN